VLHVAGNIGNETTCSSLEHWVEGVFVEKWDRFEIANKPEIAWVDCRHLLKYGIKVTRYVSYRARCLTSLSETDVLGWIVKR